MSPSRAHMTNPSFGNPPTRDRTVNSRSVPCPVCDAPTGQACTWPTTTRGNHPSRRRMAVRLLNLSYTPADLGWITSVKPAARKALRRASGISQDALAREVGVSPRTLRAWESGESVPSSGESVAAYERWLRRALGQNAPEPSREASL